MHRTRRRRLAGGAFALILAAFWLTLMRPTALGGPATYTVVSGDSMEPSFHSGDYVVAQARDRYAIGDVIAFRTGGGLVLHRIVGGDAYTGYVTRGDNNPGADPWRPTVEDVLGSVVLRIPWIGDLVSTAQRPVGIGLAAGSMTTLLLVLGDGSHHRRRRPSRHVASVRGGDGLRRQLLTGARPGRARWRRWNLLVLTLVVAGLGIILVQSFRLPASETHTTTGLSYSHVGAFTYTVDVERSTVYPTETIGPITDETIDGMPPLYTRLVRAIQVDFTYSLDTESSADVSGTVSTEIRVRAGDDGWETTLPAPSPRDLSEGSATVASPIDVRRLLETISRAERETGDLPGTYRLTIAPTVVVDGAIDGATVSERFDAILEFDLSAARIEAPSELITSRAVSVTSTQQRPTSVDLPVVTIETGRLRLVAAVALLLVLAVMARVLADDSTVRRLAIRLRYGSLLVPVTGFDIGDDRARIAVPSIADLARLAKANGGLILVQESLPDVVTYTVSAEDARYEYSPRREGG